VEKSLSWRQTGNAVSDLGTDHSTLIVIQFVFRADDRELHGLADDNGQTPRHSRQRLLDLILGDSQDLTAQNPEWADLWTMMVAERNLAAVQMTQCLGRRSSSPPNSAVTGNCS
jgi:hypothetical protein